LGPVATGGYYQVGQSPFAVNGNTDSTPVIGDNKYSVPLLPTSVITIDDNDTPCDTDDVISGSISLGAATRAFAGGPGEQGEETWGDGDIVFSIPAATVDSATGNGSGCDYVIASAGFPPLLQSNGGGTYIFDVDIEEFPGPGQDSWVSPAPVGVACVTEGNCGVSVDVTVGAGWSCTDNTGGSGACSLGSFGGSHFGGTRGTLETFLISVSTNSGGEITSGTIFANNEAKVFSVPPDPFNSWDGSILSFMGVVCNDCEPPPPPPPPPPATPLYAITGDNNTPSTLYELDRNTAAVVRTVGPTGFNYITAMDFHPLTGELYAIAQDASSCCPYEGDLMTLDLDSGAASIIARTNAFEDIGFHPDGRLFGQARVHNSPNGDAIYEIDIDNGQFSRVLNFHPHGPGISFDSVGAGIAKDGSSYYAFNPDVPSTLFLGNIGGATPLNTLEFDQDNILLTVTFSSLVALNVNSGTQTTVGPVTTRYSALASQPVPCYAVDAIDDQYTLINDGSTADLTVLRNDECRSDRPISIVTLSGDLLPDQGGSASTDGSIITYTPLGGVTGQESFTYTAQDAGLDGGEDPPAVDQDTATVTVTLLEDLIPDAVDDDLDIQQYQTVYIDVLENDTLGNPEHVVSLETLPANGTANVEADNRVRYYPNSRFFGLESFQYRLTDANGDSDVAAITIGVFFVSGTVPIDIMPGKDINNINLQAGGRIQIAILSVGEFFNAPALINPLSLKFGPREANIIGAPSVRDIDHDGDDDLLVKFLIEQSGIVCGQLNAFLFGETFEFGFVNGFDSINTFKCRRKPISY
jgi:hypothetical protein